MTTSESTWRKLRPRLGPTDTRRTPGGSVRDDLPAEAREPSERVADVTDTSSGALADADAGAGAGAGAASASVLERRPSCGGLGGLSATTLRRLGGVEPSLAEL